jgi:hypothetical protein
MKYLFKLILLFFYPHHYTDKVRWYGISLQRVAFIPHRWLMTAPFTSEVMIPVYMLWTSFMVV